MNRLRKIALSIIILSFIAFFIYTFYSVYHGNNEYIKRQYSGIILIIRTLPGSHDLPDIKINNEWIALDIPDSKVKHYIQVGDSIVKESGSAEIRVYRRNQTNEWQVKIFK